MFSVIHGPEKDHYSLFIPWIVHIYTLTVENNYSVLSHRMKKAGCLSQLHQALGLVNQGFKQPQLLLTEISLVSILSCQICDTKIMHKNNFDQNKRTCVLWCIIIKHVNKLQWQEVYILCDSVQHHMQIITIILWSPWYWSSW